MAVADLPSAELAVLSRRRPRSAGPVLAGAFLALLAVAMIAPELLAPGSPDATSTADILRPPSADHLFGTDQNGRDIYRRIVYGARDSVFVGLAATALALVAGVLVGAFAALAGRAADSAAMRLVEVLLAVPGMVTALLVAAALGPGSGTVVLAIAVIGVPPYARIVRGQILRLRGSGFVEAAVAQGLGPVRVAWRHMIPNALPPVLLLGTIGTGAAIGASAALSFLGLGPRPPDPQWGAMLQQGQDYFAVAWWTATVPGVVLTLTVLSVTTVGQYLQRRFEGRVPG
ncbi:ABC transporter permease [Plantactinospora endophytica]|uniref:Peptide ABC transporter permease n=1 Tax=Plantactinospora endophytica TaxID=673535 RepID=A0ABQ4E241_9ACTN|nr:ABC transporter permease [Plantactinospora endophytica]GIG88774.1 peptide ABC transporter permease [Plantactinospora endophytica]